VRARCRGCKSFASPGALLCFDAGRLVSRLLNKDHLRERHVSWLLNQFCAHHVLHGGRATSPYYAQCQRARQSNANYKLVECTHGSTPCSSCLAHCDCPHYRRCSLRASYAIPTRHLWPLLSAIRRLTSHAPGVGWALSATLRFTLRPHTAPWLLVGMAIRAY
jgi:hypothetical protein